MATMTIDSKTAALESKIAAMSHEQRGARILDLSTNGEFEQNRAEFVKLLFGPDAVEVAD